jgi:hypothetical protein
MAGDTFQDLPWMLQTTDRNKQYLCGLYTYYSFCYTHIFMITFNYNLGTGRD